jgi:hypothetical protein
MEGSFNAGQFGYSTPQGTWSGQSPTVTNEVGSPTELQTGKTLWVRSLTPFSTCKGGDYFQLGSGSTARLHKLTQDATADSGGFAQLCFTPRLRSSPAHGAAVTLLRPQGLWMLDSNDTGWSIEEAMLYGLSFSAMEDIRGL